MLRGTFFVLLATATLLGTPVALRPGPDSPANAFARNLGGGELVGEVVNTSNRALKRRVQVRAGGREWTLHVPERTPITTGQGRVSIHDLDIGTYVRARGQRIGSTRLRANRVFVIGDRLALRRASSAARRGGENGYFMNYAGYRSSYRR